MCSVHKLYSGVQADIYQHIVEEGWFRVSGVNQVMLFGHGDLPEWCRQLAASLPSLHFPSLVRGGVTIFCLHRA